MEGKVIAFENGFYKVDCEGVIYNCTPKLFLRRIKIGDQVILDSKTFKIIEVL